MTPEEEKRAGRDKSLWLKTGLLFWFSALKTFKSPYKGDVLKHVS